MREVRRARRRDHRRHGDRRTRRRSRPGFLEIAVANMANAIKQISVQRGYDVTEYMLASFGGAGGQHACAVADALGMTRVFIHPLAGVLSAYGMGLADVSRCARGGRGAADRPIWRPLPARRCRRWSERRAPSWQPRARRRRDRGDPPRAPALRRHRHGAGVPRRCAGEMTARLRASLPQALRLPDAGQARHRRGGVGRGRSPPAHPRETARTRPPPGPRRPVGRPAQRGHVPTAARADVARAGWRAVPLYRRRDARRPGRPSTARRSSPSERHHGRRARLAGAVTARRRPGADPRRAAPGDRARATTEARSGDAGGLQQPVHVHRRADGRAAADTAHSVNIKERLDFSCALFDADGNLIANAPHMPVHLGSMGETIKTVIARNGGRMRPGRRVRAQRSVQRRHPPARRHRGHAGVRHPPVPRAMTGLSTDDARDAIRFYVASRGHHADIGGITPGSMPPSSTRVEEEGVLIDNWLLVADGRLREAETGALLGRRRYPSRNPRQNIADLRAQIAANEKGVQELHRMVGALRPRRGARLHAARAGQRRGSGAPRDHRAARRRVRLRTGQRRGHQGQGDRRPAAPGPPTSTSPAPARSSPTISTRPRPWRWRRCCMCSARWWTTTSR